MGFRIPQSFVDELLARTDIVSLLEPYVQLKKIGINYKGLCPFHQEKTPSFIVSSTKQLYHCFGCGASGNALSFLMSYERLDFSEAVSKLASLAGLEVPKEMTHTFDKKEQFSELYAVMEKCASFYQRQLKNPTVSKKAVDYLKRRDLTGQMAKQFCIGFAPPGWDNLRLFFRDKKQDPLLLNAGMLIQKDTGGVYDRFRDRIMFPIRNRRGQVVGFGGRVIDQGEPKYLNSPETPIFQKSKELYGLYEVLLTRKTLKRMLVVEGYMDVVALWQHGIEYAVATLGTATSTEHLFRLCRLVPEVVFCFDGDRAGFDAAWRALNVVLPILRDEWKIRFIFLPQGEDPDSLIRKIGRRGFERSIDEAVLLSDFFFNHLADDLDLTQVEGRATFAKKALSYIENMPNNFTREMFMEELGRRVGMDVEKIQTYFSKGYGAPSQGELSEPSNVRGSPVRLAVALLLQSPLLAKKLEITSFEGEIPGLDVLNELVAFLKNKNYSASTAQILEFWRDKPQGKYLSRLAVVDLMIPLKGLEEEFFGAIKRIERKNLEVTIEILMSKAAKGQLEEGEKKHLQALLMEKQKDLKR